MKDSYLILSMLANWIGTVYTLLLRKIASLLIRFFGLIRRRRCRRAHRPQVGIGAGVEGVLKLLGVDLAVLVQNMGVDLGEHVNLSVARVALGGLQVAVVESLAGRAAMPSTMARTRAAACSRPLNPEMFLPRKPMRSGCRWEK